MTEKEREGFIHTFDAASILNNLEENNKLVVDFMLGENSMELPLEVFDVLYREVLFLKKACEKNENWYNLIDVYMKNINSVRNNEKVFYYLIEGNIKKAALSDKVKTYLKKGISLCISYDLENLEF